MMTTSDLHKDDMKSEYDFTTLKGGVRGKYRTARRESHTVRIEKPDGTVEVQHHTLEDGVVMLDPDVQSYFPTSADVNDALRALIRLAQGIKRSA